MKNREKSLLRQLCKAGRSVEHIKTYLDCADSTIKKYQAVFSPESQKTIPNNGRQK